MESFKAKTLTPILLVLVLLPCVICSSSQQHIKEDMLNNHHQVVEPISHRLSLQIVIHGFLLWASMGFLIPVGILAIRLSNREENERRLRIMFCIHAVTQASFANHLHLINILNHIIIPTSIKTLFIKQ